MKVSRAPRPPFLAEQPVDWESVVALLRANPGVWVLHPDLTAHPHTRSANMTVYARKNASLRGLGGTLETAIRNGEGYRAPNNAKRYRGDLWIRWTED